MSRPLRLASSLCALTLCLLSCAGDSPPAPAAMGEAVPAGPFTLRVSRLETVSLTETFSRTGEGLGLALFLRLSLSDSLASDLAALLDEDRRIGQQISNLRATRKDYQAEESELTERVIEVVDKLEEASERRARLLRRLRVVDAAGNEYRPSGFVAEKSYQGSMRWRSGSAEEPFLRSASDNELGRIERVDPEQDWVVLFKAAPAATGLTLLIENPEPWEGQLRRFAVPLGR